MNNPAWPSVHEWPTGTQGGRNLRLPWPKVARWIGESVGIPTDQVALSEVFILRSWSISAHVVARSTPPSSSKPTVLKWLYPDLSTR